MIHQILQFILHFRILPRSSSLREPRDPSLKGVFVFSFVYGGPLVSQSRGECVKKNRERRRLRNSAAPERTEPEP